MQHRRSGPCSGLIGLRGDPQGPASQPPGGGVAIADRNLGPINQKAPASPRRGRHRQIIRISSSSRARVSVSLAVVRVFTGPA